MDELNRLPERYRNKLYRWTVIGPYSGCLEKPSHGFVDRDGDYHAFNHGEDLNLRSMLEDEVQKVRRKHGFGDLVEDPETHLHQEIYRVRQAAEAEVFGADLGKIPWEKAWSDARVLKIIDDRTANLKARVKACRNDEDAARAKVQATLNDFFRQTLENWENKVFVSNSRVKTPFNAFVDTKVEEFDFGEERIKDSCLLFCNSTYDVSVSCGVLDGVAYLGYDPWCVCSDCGEQFQLRDFERFSHLIDGDSYVGNGGIGVFMTRVMCEDCHSATECPSCFENNLPTAKEKKAGMQYDHVSFPAKFMMEWLGMCSVCAENWLSTDDGEDRSGRKVRGGRKYDDDLRRLEETVDSGKETVEKYVALLRERGRHSEERLEELRRKNLADLSKAWTEEANALRDRMEADAADYFDECADWGGRRLDKPEEFPW
ncbi:MAG: hypothetical protein HUJ63_01445 [Enterococcus sp.]|nr:hypothetical protein [Enterococcus sp.]